MKNSIIVLVALLLSISGIAQNKNTTLLGSKSYPSSTLHGALNDVWGHVDSLGNEYAIVGLQKGISIVDVTDPTNLTEVFYVAGVSTIWRDIKTWDDHAYITNESSGGMMIIDMSALPGTITSSDVYYHTGTSYPFNRAHNLFIDENGTAYVFGSNYSNRGAIFLDLNSNPKIPLETGVFDSLYFHDGMARGDTLWGAAVYTGEFYAIDVSTKSAPVILKSHYTSGYFAHNCWISDDGNTLYTTDEISGGAIGSYDVSDLSNIDELDLNYSNPGSGVIPHNTHVHGDFLVTSYYRDGITIVDATYPDLMIQVGDYDTSPSLSGNGFNGCWGVYPYLPSGNILATDIENGLYVIGADYTKGVYIQGNTRKFSDSSNLGLTLITHVNSGTTFSSNLNAFYKESYERPGWHQFAFFKPGYLRDTIDIFMTSGQMHNLNLYLRKETPFTLSGTIKDAGDGSLLANAEVYLDWNYLSYRAETNAQGYFEIDSVYEGTYDLTGGKFMYKNACYDVSISDGDSLEIFVEKQIYDDFTFDFGWSASGNGSNGFWEIENLNFAPYVQITDFPIADDSTDCSTFAFVTGHSNAGDHDVDGGWNYLYSPSIDASSIVEPVLSFSYWFNNDASSGNEDSLILEVMDVNANVKNVFKVNNATLSNQSQWIDTSFVLSQYNLDMSNIELIFKVGDFGNDNLLEAGIDHIQIISKYVGINESAKNDEIRIFPNPFTSEINYSLPIEFFRGNYIFTDITGRELLRGDIEDPKGLISVPNYIPSGMLIISFYSENGRVISERIIKR